MPFLLFLDELVVPLDTSSSALRTADLLNMHTAGDDLQDDFALEDLESDGLAAEVEETRDYISEEENEPQSGPSTIKPDEKKRKRREKLKERKVSEQPTLYSIMLTEL